MKALILNYGVGNLFSVSSALKRMGFEVNISTKPGKNYDLLVLPGVGSFKAVSLYISNMSEEIKDSIKEGTNVLGICLGMQILFEYSTEYGFSKGLGVLEGYVDKIVTTRKLPHIGWDKIYFFSAGSSECETFAELDNEYVYFVHSYAAYPKRIDYICMISIYDMLFPAAVVYKNVVGTQFHPEKSGIVGQRFLEILVNRIKR